MAPRGHRATLAALGCKTGSAPAPEVTPAWSPPTHAPLAVPGTLLGSSPGSHQSNFLGVGGPWLGFPTSWLAGAGQTDPWG